MTDKEAGPAREIDLHGTSDARVWSKEFVRINGGDEEMMAAWFANSFMAGYDWGKGPLNGEHAESLGKNGLEMEAARGIAARCWCQPKTEKKEMDVELAEEFAKSLLPYLRKAALCERMAKALRIYARRYKDGECWNWNIQACDSYSGAVPHFDYEGDEQEEPWEMAEKALADYDKEARG